MTNLDFNDFFEQLKNQHQSSSEQMSRPGEIMTARYIRPDYQAAYSQLARKFTILERILNPSVLVDAEANCIITEAVELIEKVEEAERTMLLVREFDNCDEFVKHQASELTERMIQAMRPQEES